MIKNIFLVQKKLKKISPQTGFEPKTLSIEARYSTIELLRFDETWGLILYIDLSAWYACTIKYYALKKRPWTLDMQLLQK